MSKKKNMSFGIIGLGRFGSALARALAEAGKEVLVVDKNEAKIKEIRQYTDYAYVVDTITKEALQEIGMQNCDTVIVCIGEQIDTSILTTLNVVSLGVPKVIAKAISADQGIILEKIGAEVVYPEHDMAIRLAKKLVSSSVIEYISLSNDIEISEIKLNQKFFGKSIAKIDIRPKYGLNIIAIEHQRKTTTIIDPNYVFTEGDIIVVIGNNEGIKRFEEYMLH